MSSSLIVVRKPKGLQNIENTRYLISVLQSLSYLEAYTSLFDTFTVKNPGPDCTLRLVQSLMDSFRNPKTERKVLSASGIISNLLMWSYRERKCIRLQ
jgi:hypothetical protein